MYLVWKVRRKRRTVKIIRISWAISMGNRRQAVRNHIKS